MNLRFTLFHRSRHEIVPSIQQRRPLNREIWQMNSVGLASSISRCGIITIDTRNTFSTTFGAAFRSGNFSWPRFIYLSLAGAAAPILQKNYGTPINLISTESFPYDGRSRFLMICGEKMALLFNGRTPGWV